MDLMPIYETLANGQPGLVFDAHPEYARKDIAEAARQDAVRAALEGRPDIMFLASSAAAMIYLKLGDRPQSLLSRLDALQALFMLSEAEADYDDVRDQALELHQMAREISSPRITLGSLVIAADCSWFSTDAVGDRDQSAQKDRLGRTLGDVLAALRAVGPLADDPAARVWVERLASIVAVSADAAMSEAGSDEQPDMDPVLRQLAAAADVLPIDMKFEGHGSGKAAGVAAVLEQLESRYRSGLAARPRWCQTSNGRFPFAARVSGRWWVLRLNNFPDHPLWTLFIDGAVACDFDDRPPEWGKQEWDTAPLSEGSDEAEALTPVQDFVAYGSEIGRPCRGECCP